MTVFRHFGIAVSDLEQALAFYEGLLGLNVETKKLEEGPFLESILGIKGVRVTTVKMSGTAGPQIELLAFEFPTPLPPRSFTQYGPTHIALTVTDIDMLYDRMLEANIDVNTPPSLSPDGKVKVMFCRDPDQTWLELVEVIGSC